ncbi:hypothetical protein [Ideonella sp.]|uniref:hypothetical protein n=1 Tax=Ideonella sp. TaxID=1929293 RepID=UPI002B489B92|nr:hypothetical protein [Ideonella sp.]HJV67816.1 hypothetical protein [Ideonella sp.]
MGEPDHHVFSSSSNPAGAALVPLYVSGVFRETPLSFRAQLIETLMRPMGALGLVAVANGVFAAVRHRHGWERLQVTLDDTARITADQVLELASYLQQAAPEVFRQVGELISSQPAVASGVSAVLLLQLLRIGRRRR